MRSKLFISILLVNLNLVAYAPTNLFRPYDSNLKMFDLKLKDGLSNYRFGVNAEGGDTTSSGNYNTNKVNLLDIYQDSQSSIAMLLGAPSGSAIEQLALDISPATDDGVRGHFKLTGAKYREVAYTFYLQHNYNFKSIPGMFSIIGYLPLRDMGITGVNFVDQTKSITSEDLLVKENVTNDISTVASNLGGLDIGDWEAQGVGDLAVLFGWQGDFKQETNRSLDKVKITGRVGLTLPTGKTKDENRAFSLPLGNDGAIGIPCIGSIDMYFKSKLVFGIELEYLKLLNETRTRRLKTDSNQTDFLLLNKGRVRKDFGDMWKFNLYLQALHFYDGLSAKVAFQHAMHDDDRLHVKSNFFDGDVINTAESLQDWKYHNLIFQTSYDFFKDSKRAVKPQLSLFYKVSLESRRMIKVDTFGGQIACAF